MNDTREKVRAFIIEHFLFGQGADLGDADSFLETGVLDSTGVLELVAFLDRAFSIKMDDSELVPDNLDSINAICAYLQRKQPQK
jgi:acyl carrier protein